MVSYEQEFEKLLGRYDLENWLDTGLTESEIKNIETLLGCKFPKSIKAAFKLIGYNFFNLFLGGASAGRNNDKIGNYLKKIQSEFYRLYLWNKKNEGYSIDEEAKIKELLSKIFLLVLNISYIDDVFWYCDCSKDNPEVYLDASGNYPARESFVDLFTVGLIYKFKFKVRTLQNKLGFELKYRKEDEDEVEMQERLKKWEAIAKKDNITLIG